MSAANAGAADAGAPVAELAAIRGYHAHVYYDEASRGAAERLRERLAERFEVELGRWHDRPIGPHPRWSYQVAFAPEVFAEIVPFLMLNRDGLIIFLHPDTGADVPDHRDHPLWMGESLEVDLAALERDS
ncbi:MAG: DOPA 4,5-dioxygenase family protein [Alphaproteobacteria bacterium]